MSRPTDGLALVYCQGAFEDPIGKTAHGLVRHTRRYRVLSVIDSTTAGRDAGQVLDGRRRDIPILASLEEAIDNARNRGLEPSHLVIGLAPDGGRLEPEHRRVVARALAAGLNVDSGLHDFLSLDPELSDLAEDSGAIIRDIRRPPDRDRLHFFSGRIDEVDCLRLAVLGTDSAIGKRTTAWMLIDALARAGHPVEMIGTGQTAWLQGARHGLVLDSLVNDFVSGEIEHAVVSAWDESRPEAIIIEGQGGLLNPAYPGGFEILAAARPQAIIVQHAPGRRDYDGFPGRPIHPLDHQIKALELIGEVPVAAVTVNHEGLTEGQAHRACDDIAREFGLPVVDPVLDGVEPLLPVLSGLIAGKGAGQVDGP